MSLEAHGPLTHTTTILDTILDTLNLLNRKDEMAKIISDKYASKDSPIFTGRYTISNPKVSTKKPIKVNQENLKETDPFFDGVKEIKRR